MRYFLGIDGGATKSKAIIVDDNEKTVAECLGGPVNYHQGGGTKLTHQNLEKVIKQILILANLKTEDLDGVVLGLAGRDSPKDEKILDELAQNLLGGSFKGKIKVVSDLETAFVSSVSKEYGVILISGTGANCFAKGKTGKTARAGDWGYLLGDQGSGFALGLGALRAVMREFDGRGKKTLLAKLILDKLSLSELLKLIDWVYQKEVLVAEIAGLAPLVFQAYDRQDKVAKDLVNKLIVEMVLSVKTVAVKTGLVGEEFEVGLVGGIFKEETAVSLLEKEIKKVLPGANLVLSRTESAMAAAIMAQQSPFKGLSL